MPPPRLVILLVAGASNFVMILSISSIKFKFKFKIAGNSLFSSEIILMAHSRSFLANQKARNAIIGAENLLNINKLSNLIKTDIVQL